MPSNCCVCQPEFAEFALVVPQFGGGPRASGCRHRVPRGKADIRPTHRDSMRKPRQRCAMSDSRYSVRRFWDDRGSNSDALTGGRFSYHSDFRRCRSPAAHVVWTVPWPYARRHVGRARPVSTPSRSAAPPEEPGRGAERAWLGVVMRPSECSNVREEFTDFERIPIVVSGRSAHRCKSAVSPNSTIIPCRDVGPRRCAIFFKKRARNSTSPSLLRLGFAQSARF